MKKKRITLAECEKAEKLILSFYSQDFKKLHGNDRPCIICGKGITPLYPEMIRQPQSGMYHNGLVDRISANYGSNHDGNMYIIAICDDCLRKLKEANKIEYAGNYMNY